MYVFEKLISRNEILSGRFLSSTISFFAMGIKKQKQSFMLIAFY